MKGVGKKGILLPKLHFLRYSTGESDMILEFIFCRPIIKILIYHFTISYLVIGPFSEISGKFPEFPRKFPGNFSEFSPFPIPTPLPYVPIPTHPSPTHIYSDITPLPQLQFDFSPLCNLRQSMPFFPNPFIYFF